MKLVVPAGPCYWCARPEDARRDHEPDCPMRTVRPEALKKFFEWPPVIDPFFYRKDTLP